MDLQVPNREPDFQSGGAYDYWFEENIRAIKIGDQYSVPVRLLGDGVKLRFISKFQDIICDIHNPKIQKAYKRWVMNVKVDKILLGS